MYWPIHEYLAKRDPNQLVEHWTYFFDREDGGYTLDRDGDNVTLTVHRCPAIAHLEHKGVEIDPAFRRQTVVIHETIAEGTPFEITTEVQVGGKCVQRIRRGGDQAQCSEDPFSRCHGLGSTTRAPRPRRLRSMNATVQQKLPRAQHHLRPAVRRQSSMVRIADTRVPRSRTSGITRVRGRPTAPQRSPT